MYVDNLLIDSDKCSIALLVITIFKIFKVHI